MYTDNYNENDNEEREVSYKETNNSNNSLRIIIIVILAIILLALLYFVFKGKFGSKEPDKYTLSIYPESIVIPLGKSQNISYEVRKNNIIVPEASVRLTIVDESVASVDNTIVTGLKYGKTIVMASYVSTDGKTFQETKDITVADGNPSVAITNVTFPDGDLQMPFNGTYNINLGINPPNGFVENKVITSSNPNVVTVDNTGSVTAISEGEAIISIDINNGTFKKDIMVYVTRESEISKLVVSPTSITINNPVSKLKVGETANLKYDISPTNASIDNIKWTSSNENVLTVDYRGKVTAVKEGLATIKVQTFNNLSDTISIQVEKKEVEITDISLSITDLYLTVGESQMVVPIINPADATDKGLTYTIDNSSVVQILPSSDTSSVTITPLAVGTAVLTIKANTGNAVKTLNIIVAEATEPSGGVSGGSSCSNKCKEDCGAGKYCSCGKCVGCPAGNYCYNNKKTACAAGKGSIANSSSYQDCSNCAKGYYATGDGKGCQKCPAGLTTSSSGATSKDACNVESGEPACAAGKYLIGKTCADCPTGSYCPGDNAKYSCPSGKTTKGSGSKNSSACSVKVKQCDAGSYLSGSNCITCPKGSYCYDNTKHSCPVGKTTNSTGSTSISACVTIRCSSGRYLSGSTCIICPKGSYCYGNNKYSCPTGKTTTTTGATSSASCK